MAKSKKPDGSITTDQRKLRERRAALERRTVSAGVPTERRVGQRREKVNRRRQIDPTTCERDYTDAEVEFMHALDQYKRTSGRMFPTCSEILEVLRDLGYAKVAGGEVATPGGMHCAGHCANTAAADHSAEPDAERDAEEFCGSIC